MGDPNPFMQPIAPRPSKIEIGGSASPSGSESSTPTESPRKGFMGKAMSAVAEALQRQASRSSNMPKGLLGLAEGFGTASYWEEMAEPAEEKSLKE